MIDFSVLITVYKNDVPAYFREALESITIAQTLSPSEVIIVCDGTVPDEILTIIEEFETRCEGIIISFKLPKNIGQGEALNFGLRKCSHEYVARMDSDDISLPNRFKEQISFLNSNPKIDILSSTVKEFNQEGNLAERLLPIEHDDLVSFAKFRAPVNHGCCVYKKSKVLLAGAYSGLYQCQDYKLWVDMLLEGCRFHNLSQCHMDVRMYEGYTRKVGLAYLKEEFYLQSYFYKKGFISFPRCVVNLFLRGSARLAPTTLINFLYKRVVRGL